MLLGFIGSAWQWIIVLAIVLLLFGNRLPMVARSLGRSLTEFKKGVKDVDEDPSTSQLEDQDLPRSDEYERASRERVAR
ncbi:MAG: twin-arginine translocase TatA/TatE family subunit [Pirellulales bacterium]